MRVLVIDEAAKARAKALREYAFAHRENLSSLMQRMGESTSPAPGDNPNFVLELFDSYHAVLTVEQQPDPVGWCYHFSVSVTQPHAVPDQRAVDMILEALGIKTRSLMAIKCEFDNDVVELWLPLNEDDPKSL
jgi:hypothetical protein